MIMNYILLAIGCAIILLLGVIALKLVTSGKPLWTKETDENITVRLEKQNELNREIGNELKNAGYFQSRKWKKELGLELYTFYLKEADK
jgi:hypothetical protein